MPAPYDYSMPLPDPTANFLQGLQIVSAFEQQKAARAEAEQRQQVLSRIIALGDKAKASDFIEASLALPGDRELFKQTWDMLDESKKEALFKGGSEAYLLADSDPEAAAARLEEYAIGYENANDSESSRQFRDAARVVRLNPQAAKATIGTMLALADGERFKSVAQPVEATSFQKDFQFIRDTFGNDAAAEFAQFGRGGIVSIPLPGGKTYVGPASMAPGATRWNEQENESAPEILQKAAASKTISAGEAQVIRQSLGQNGQAAFDKWLRENKIAVAQTVNGVTYYQIDGKWYDNPEGK